MSLYEREHIIDVFPAKAQYHLPDSLLIPGSETVWADSAQLQSDVDYTVEYVRGIISLKRELPSGTAVKAHYKIWPFPLKRVQFRRRLVTEQAQEQEPKTNGHAVSLPPRRVPAPSRKAFGGNLKKSGSLIRGITVGSNQDLQVDSGLRMQVSGRLADNVHVVASLTDRNTPLQPEGNTQTLQEIDKVFVQLNGPNFSATLGDYNLDLLGTEFTRYNRKLQGAMGTADIGNMKITVSGAVSRGRFTTNEFLGREGNQGPYQLTGEGGQINIIVLAGTERVWLDGELVTRGENHDYVIEYGNGQITFTRNRLITSDSRITVDFQFSDESFQRNLWGMRGESKLLNDRVKIGTTFIRETDDKNNLLSGRELSNESTQALTAAGDSAAVVPGWTFVGQDSGNYIQESTGIFVFVGNNQGDHTVSFSFFGANNGDYRNIGLGRYEYVGENLGSYRPFIVLPQARRHDVVGFNLDLAPHSSLSFGSEIAISQFDRNLFSSADDGDNAGTAYSFNLSFRPEKILIAGRDLGRLDLRGRLRSKGASFRDIDRTTPVEFNRKWNLSNDQTHTENIGELSASYSPITDLKFSGGVGRLTQSDAISSNRWEAQATMIKPNLPQFDYFVENIQRRDQSLQNSSWLRHRGHVDYDLKKVKPLLDFESEIRKDATGDSSQIGFRYESVTGGLQLAPWPSTTASFSYNYRNDKDRVGGVFLPKSVARTQFYSWSFRKGQSFSAKASYTHRTRDFADIAVQDTRTDLADLRIGYSPRKGGLRTNVYYQISNTQIARQEEVFLEVEDGEGNFRFNEELNEFEPDPFGNFLRQVVATNDFIPVVELRFRTDLRLTPKRLFGSDKKAQNVSFFERLLSPITTESFVRIDERTKEKDVERIYLLKLSHFQQDSTTIFGSIEVRQDIHLWENSRRLSLRYRLRKRMEKNNQFVGGGQDRDLLQHQFRILNRFSNQVTARLDYLNTSEDRIFESTGREDRQVRSHEFEVDFVYRPQRRLEFALKSEFSLNRDVEQIPATKASLFSFAPRSSYSLNKKGRFRGEIDWTKVFVAPKSRLIPFELTDGNRAGTTLRWNFGFEYRMAQNVQASLSYFGRSEPDRPNAQHFAKVEMRAFF